MPLSVSVCVSVSLSLCLSVSLSLCLSLSLSLSLNHTTVPLFAACREVRYISTRDTGLSGQTTYEIPTSRSYFDKQVYCIRKCMVNGTNPKPCYGFSVDQITDTCTLYYDFDHPLGVISASPGVDQYRRILYCSK